MYGDNSYFLYSYSWSETDCETLMVDAEANVYIISKGHAGHRIIAQVFCCLVNIFHFQLIEIDYKYITSEKMESPNGSMDCMGKKNMVITPNRNKKSTCIIILVAQLCLGHQRPRNSIFHRSTQHRVLTFRPHGWRYIHGWKPSHYQGLCSTHLHVYIRLHTHVV